MMTAFAIDQPSTPVITSGIVQGLGLGLIFVPLQTLAFETLTARLRTTGAATATTRPQRLMLFMFNKPPVWWLLSPPREAAVASWKKTSKSAEA